MLPQHGQDFLWGEIDVGALKVDVVSVPDGNDAGFKGILLYHDVVNLAPRPTLRFPSVEDVEAMTIHGQRVEGSNQ